MTGLWQLHHPALAVGTHQAVCTFNQHCSQIIDLPSGATRMAPQLARLSGPINGRTAPPTLVSQLPQHSHTIAVPTAHIQIYQVPAAYQWDNNRGGVGPCFRQPDGARSATHDQRTVRVRGRLGTQLHDELSTLGSHTQRLHCAAPEPRRDSSELRVPCASWTSTAAVLAVAFVLLCDGGSCCWQWRWC